MANRDCQPAFRGQQINERSRYKTTGAYIEKDYQSVYDGPQMDERWGDAGTAVQGVSVNGTEAEKDTDNKVHLTIDKTTVGLGQVDNTPDAQKPVSEAQSAAINTESHRAQGAEEILAQAIEQETERASLTEQALYEGKEDVIPDLTTIREGASAGATALQPSALNSYRTASQQDAVDNTKVDKTTTVNGHALSENVTVTKADVGLGNVDNTRDTDKPISTATQGALDAINGKIPTQASSTNQLADKDFVNSSINASAAFYITSNASGDAFATKAALLAGPYYNGGALRTPTKNDYAIVLADESKGNATTRYSFDGSVWAYQYKVNDTPLTAAQLAALNSGINAEKVAEIDDKVNKVSGKGLSTNDYTNAEKTKLAGLNNYDDTAIKGRVTAIENKEDGWDAKQEAISDLEDIREGAALGATALQAVPSTYRTSAAQDVIDGAMSDRIGAIEDKLPEEFGDIVTHDADEFATAEQGQKADTALQTSALAPYRTASEQDIIDAGKQATLVSGTNIKTINSQSILGSGNIVIQGGGGTTDHGALEHLDYESSGHTGFQPTISDLATIRSGAAKGDTALQPSALTPYRTAVAQDAIDELKATIEELAEEAATRHGADSLLATAIEEKVDKVTGKGLSTNDFTTPEKTKLSGLTNYDDTAVKGRLAVIEGKEDGWDAKADISDIPTKTSDLTNDSGFLTQHQSLAEYRKSAAQDVIDNAIKGRLDTIEGKESGWDAKYAKPSGGIPKTDLESGVQASLEKADSALQEHQSLAAYRTSAAQDVIDGGKQPTLVSGTNIKTVNNQSLLGSGNIEIQGGDSDAVKFTAQTLTDAQKEQAKTNIDAAGKTLVVSQSASVAINPNRITKLGTLSGAVTLSLAIGETGKASIYDIIFSTGTSVPTITWPSGIVWAGGGAPTINASKNYEVSISENLAIITEF